MIIKFDHITFVGTNAEEDLIKNVKKECQFFEKGLKISPSKRKFMANSQTSCDMYYCGNRRIPSEYIFYDITSTNGGCIDLIDDIIICRSQTEDYRLFFEDLLRISPCEKSLGEQGTIYNLRGVFDKRDYYCKIIKESDTKSVKNCTLDQEGWNCPCLLVDNDLDKIISACVNLENIYFSIDRQIINGR